MKARRFVVSSGTLSIALLLFAFVLRLYHLDYQPAWSDERDVLEYSSQSLTSLLQNFNRPGWNGPLHYLLLSFWLKGTGASLLALRYFSLLWGLLSIALARPLGDKLLGLPYAGWGLSLVMAAAPYLVWYAQDGKMYSLLLFLSMAALLCLLISVHSNHWFYWSAFVLITGAMWYVHILSALLLPFYLLVAWHRGSSTVKRRLVFIFILLSLLNLPLLSWEIKILISPFETGHPYQSLLTILRTQLYAFSVAHPSPVESFTVLLTLFIVITGTLRSLSFQPGRLILLYFLLPLLAIYLISLGMPIYADRYLITIAPAFYSLLVLGFLSLPSHSKAVNWGGLVLWLCLNCITIYHQANTFVKPVALALR